MIGLWLLLSGSISAAAYTQEPSTPPPITQQEYAARRSALAAKMQDGVMIAIGAPEPEVDYLSFWQRPSLLYLTGFKEPNAALVMVKRNGRVTSTMFVQPRDPTREVWTGTRLGPDGVAQVTGMQGALHSTLRSALDSLLGTAPTHLYVVGDLNTGHDALTADDQFVRTLTTAHPNVSFRDASSMVGELRAHKSDAELALLQRAIDITVDAQHAAFGLMAPNKNEYEVQALIEYTFRSQGADRPSFATIVGSGPNSTTLHYNADTRIMRAGEIVVMDIGASYDGYAADVTRTVPINGTYSPEQRAIYQAVRNTQAAAERAAVLGAPAHNMVDSANATIAQELTKLGLIESPTATYACPSQGANAKCLQYRLYYMHGLGHAIGLDVHDIGTSGVQSGTLQPGDAFTIEPGIYVRANTIDIIDDVPENQALKVKLRPVVEQYKNIGVRIEDDYFATRKGVTWASRAPREIAEIEAIMRNAKTRTARSPVPVPTH